MAAAYAKTAAPEGIREPRTNLCEKFNVSGNRPFLRPTCWSLERSNDAQKQCPKLHLPLQGGGRPRSGREGVSFRLALLSDARHDLEGSRAEKGEDQSRKEALAPAAPGSTSYP